MRDISEEVRSNARVLVSHHVVIGENILSTKRSIIRWEDNVVPTRWLLPGKLQMARLIRVRAKGKLIFEAKADLRKHEAGDIESANTSLVCTNISCQIRIIELVGRHVTRTLKRRSTISRDSLLR